jgi:hypothetical protein
MADEFSQRQVEMILRRTAELELHREGALEQTTAEDLERIATELGMSQTALRQAMSEARAGLLAAPEDEPRSLAHRVFGGGFVEVRRFVPGDAGQVGEAVERFFKDQGFEVMRHRGDVTLWERDRSWGSSLRRAFSSRTYRLPRDIEIESHIAAISGGPHPVLVRIRVDTRRVRTGHARGAVAAIVGGAAVAVTGAVMLPIPPELALWGAGAALGAGGTIGSRASYRTVRERLAIALERFLDFLEHPPPTPAPSKDPLTRIVDFLSSEWWK